MDGLTCARRIRELEQTEEIIRHVPIIGITANARSEQIASCIDAGMDEVVVSTIKTLTSVSSADFRKDETIPGEGSASTHASSCRPTQFDCLICLPVCSTPLLRTISSFQILNPSLPKPSFVTYKLNLH